MDPKMEMPPSTFRTIRTCCHLAGAMAASAGFGATFWALNLLGGSHVKTSAFALCFILIAVILAAFILLLTWKEGRKRGVGDEA